jgi:protein TonB
MKKRGNSTVTKSLGGLASMMLGGLVMMALVVSLNKAVEEKKEVAIEQTRIIAVKETKQQVTQITETKPAPQKAQKTKAKAAALPDLGGIIGGIEMNIPEFAAADTNFSDAKELLDEIAQDTVMSEGTVDRKPEVVNRPAMEYPKAAVSEGIKGYVVVNLLITKDGRVELAKVLDAEPKGMFENAVLAGVKEWTFSPARYKGEAVKVWAKQRVSFGS